MVYLKIGELAKQTGLAVGTLRSKQSSSFGIFSRRNQTNP